MEYKIQNSDIILTQFDFDLEQTLDCGQAFRWEKISDNEQAITYQGHFLNKFLKISQCENKFTFHDTSENEFLSVWRDYFDLQTDYSEYKKFLSKDITLKKATEYAGGIRLLRQDFWECLISFIISQNNNIPRIKKIITSMCEHFGEFPDAKTLLENDIGFLKSGFREKYIKSACEYVLQNNINLNDNTEDLKTTLMKIKGVGPKVSDCVLLFGLHRLESFPKDVWIKKVLEKYYPSGFPEEFYDIQGVAQQYLFHYMRRNDNE
jgi:N-glycosylase/DNA lyase